MFTLAPQSRVLAVATYLAPFSPRQYGRALVAMRHTYDDAAADGRRYRAAKQAHRVATAQRCAEVRTYASLDEMYGIQGREWGESIW